MSILTSRGSIIPLVLVSIVASSILIFSISNQVISLKKDGKSAGAIYTLQTIADNIQASVSKDTAWQQTILHNPALNGCLTANGQDCDSQTSGPIDIYFADGTGKFIGSATSNSSGFDWHGNPCNSFNSTGGDANCVFQIIVTWSCANLPCGPTKFDPSNTLIPSTPAIRLTPQIRFSAKKGTGVVINVNDPDRYGLLPFTRGWKSGSLTHECKKLGGYVNSATGVCSISSASAGSVCGSEMYMAGLNSDGTASCQALPFAASYCPPANAVVGIRSDGNFICFMF